MSARVPIGFSFPYYGHRFTQLRVCTNGYLEFGNDDALFVNAGLPSPGGARNMVAPFWDDLNFGTSVRRAYVTFDGARCVVSWIAVPRYNDLGSVMTFQALLYPTGEIRLQYLHMTGNDGNASIGIQDSTRHVGLLVAFDQAYVRDSLAVRIAPVREWVAIDPTEGFLLPGARQSVRLQVDASGLGSGTFHGAVRIASNAPAPADTGIAASMEVSGAPDVVLSPPRLDFGPNFLGAHDTLAVTISNAGVDPLHVSGVSTNAAVFTVGAAAFTLPPGDARTLPVVFAPAAIARFDGVLTVASDDPDHPLASIGLEGAGSESPAIEIGVTQLRSAEAPALRPDAIRSVRPLVVRNSGGAALTWTASAFQGAIAHPQDGPGARPALVEPAPLLPAIAQIKNTIGPGFGALGTGGPDAFGYRSIDSDAPGGPAFAWQEIEALGTRLFASADDSTTRLPLPF